ncbi:hypothetical protein PIB30_028099 [Stylosanthes scabra]|uniref:Uncharacterized protein n=1 Tax=Stylosanthes scabra TaxID=79078 RepID=A0ABU6TCP2_9FABA|nr:hypothetical protein [Stylosanthes scabra]
MAPKSAAFTWVPQPQHHTNFKALSSNMRSDSLMIAVALNLFYDALSSNMRNGILSGFNCAGRWPFKVVSSSWNTMAIEHGMQWERLRSSLVDTAPHDLHITDCLNDLHPGDHIDIKWKRNKEFPYDAIVYYSLKRAGFGLDEACYKVLISGFCET